MKYLLIILGVLIIGLLITTKLMFSWSNKSSIIAMGNSWSGFENFPERKITVNKAIKLATPYLDETYKLRLKYGRGRINRDLKTDTIHVCLKGEFYFIVKDDYPSYSPGFYLKHAVKINASTGDIIEPE